MEFTAALSHIKAQIAKATGEAVMMTAEQFVAYAGEQIKAAELDTDATAKAERLAALKSATDKLESDGTTGATDFAVAQPKAKAHTPTSTESGPGLDDVIAKRTRKVEDMAKAQTSITAVLDSDAIKAALAKNAKPTETPATGTETGAELNKSAPRVDWGLDLAAEFEVDERAARRAVKTPTAE